MRKRRTDLQRRKRSMAAPQEGLDAVRSHFERRAREGVVLSVEDLADYCSEAGISPVPSRESLSELRSEWKALATHARWAYPKVYMGALFETLGNVQVDVAEMRPNLARFNGGAKYFLTAKDCLSELLAVVPLPNKKTTSWERAVSLVCDSFPLVKTIISDQDVAISSRAFRDRMRRERDVGWVILRSRSKAFKAERAQRFLKDRLGQAMELNSEDPEKRNRWVGLLPSILEDYNSRPVAGTSIRRKDVDGSNYLDVLSQRLGAGEGGYEDFYPLSAAFDFSPGLRKELFRFSVGQRVAVSRSATYGAPSSDTSTGGAFLKRSLEGSYAPRVHVIKRSYLRSTLDGGYVPVYEVTGLAGPFYESELSLVREKEQVPATPATPPAAATPPPARRSARLMLASGKYK
jgi:hypothetical protein